MSAPSRQDTAFRLLKIATNKFAARPVDREASAQNILRYAAYLAVAVLGRDKAEHMVLRAIDDYAKSGGE